MEVRQGYKQTEVGIIPEDWKLVELRNLAKYRRGSFPQPYGLSKWYDDVLGNPFIQVVDVDNNFKLKPETKKRLSAEAEKMSVFAPKGSVILSLNGSVGRVALTQYDGFIDRTLLLFESFSIPINKNYFIYAVSAVFHEEEKKAPGAILKTITKEHLSNFLLPVPTLAEQEAIAEALSDADALIESLEALLAKKRQVKQGAMSELLSGKKRVVESGEWEVKKIGEITHSTAGGTPSTLVASYWGGNIKWMSSGELHLKKVYDVDGRITEDGLKNSSTKVIPPNCVLIGLAGQGKTRGTVAMNMVELCTNQSIAAIFPSPSFVPEYLYFNLDNRYEELRELSSGDGGRGGLNLTIINNLDISLPPLAEQNAIAEILSDIDEEIRTLEGKLSKARAVKAGMMSALLGGRIRLV